jgi:hypothetical protein
MSWHHTLSLAVRFNDYFLREPVADELPVRLSPTFQRPVRNGAGKTRQSDGTYRFVDIAPGSHRLLWSPSFEDSFATWTSWEPPLDLTLPLTDPSEVVDVDLWPTPSASVRAGTTAIRGKLVGANAVAQEVSLRRTGSAQPGRVTRTDRYGEFLFLLPATIDSTPQAQAQVQLPLTVTVTNRTVSGGTIEPAGTAFAGSNFVVRLAVATRVKFSLV